MRAAGHGIGSHTLSHRVLATLSPEAQAHEIKDSKRSLEAVLGREVCLVRLPGGWPTTYQRPQRAAGARGRLPAGIHVPDRARFAAPGRSLPDTARIGSLTGYIESQDIVAACDGVRGIRTRLELNFALGLWAKYFGNSQLIVSARCDTNPY